MRYGILDGLIDGTEKVVFDSEVSGSAASSVSTGDILSGDTDVVYTAIVFLKSNTASLTPYIRLNGDGGNNYGSRGVSGSSSTVTALVSSSTDGVFPLYANSGEIALAVARIHAVSGRVRTMETISASGISGTTPLRVYTTSGVWSNTADEIVSLLVGATSTYLDVGTRLIVLKSVNVSSGLRTGIISTPRIKNCFLEVGSHVLGSAGSGLTVSGLSGNSDIVHVIEYFIKGTSATVIVPSFQINSDSGANYGRGQTLSAASTTVSASRTTGSTYIRCGRVEASGRTTSGRMMVYAKAGNVRPVIAEYNEDINGTGISANILNAGCWSDTASEVTSYAIIPSTAGNYFDTGSYMRVYAFRPTT